MSWAGQGGRRPELRVWGATGWRPLRTGAPLSPPPPDRPASTSEESWTDSEVDSSCSGQPIHLWQFLKELLLKPHSYGRFIRWLNKEKGEWCWGRDREAVRWGGAVVLPGAGQGAAAAPTFALNITHALSLDPEPAQGLCNLCPHLSPARLCLLRVPSGRMPRTQQGRTTLLSMGHSLHPQNLRAALRKLVVSREKYRANHTGSVRFSSSHSLKCLKTGTVNFNNTSI